MENLVLNKTNSPKLLPSKEKQVLAEPDERYKWVRINFSRFLYDGIEDLYIPEAVYRGMSKFRI